MIDSAQYEFMLLANALYDITPVLNVPELKHLGTMRCMQRRSIQIDVLCCQRLAGIDDGHHGREVMMLHPVCTAMMSLQQGLQLGPDVTSIAATRAGLLFSLNGC